MQLDPSDSNPEISTSLRGLSRLDPNGDSGSQSLFPRRPRVRYFVDAAKRHFQQIRQDPEERLSFRQSYQQYIETKNKLPNQNKESSDNEISIQEVSESSRTRNKRRRELRQKRQRGEFIPQRRSLRNNSKEQKSITTTVNESEMGPQKRRIIELLNIYSESSERESSDPKKRVHQNEQYIQISSSSEEPFLQTPQRVETTKKIDSGLKLTLNPSDSSPKQDQKPEQSFEQKQDSVSKKIMTSNIANPQPIVIEEGSSPENSSREIKNTQQQLEIEPIENEGADPNISAKSDHESLELLQEETSTLANLPNQYRLYMKMQEKIDKHLIYICQVRNRRSTLLSDLMHYLVESEGLICSEATFYELKKINPDLYETFDGMTRWSVYVKGKNLEDDNLPERTFSTLKLILAKMKSDEIAKERAQKQPQKVEKQPLPQVFVDRQKELFDRVFSRIQNN